MSGSDLHSNPEVGQAVRAIRARTDASIREAESRKPDLAQAIVSLGRVSERRHAAHGALVESTDTVAKAIRKELRSGDVVVVDRWPRQMIAASPSATPFVANVDYTAGRVRDKSSAMPRWQDVLFRADALQAHANVFFGLGDAHGEFVDDGGTRAYPAGPDERLAFVMEAQTVIQAFRALIEKQAIDFDAAARRATKLTPR